MPILTVKNLSKSFGGLAAVSRFDLELYEGKLVGLIGPNGAGKTTIFNLLTGVYYPSSGSITLHRYGRSVDIHKFKPNRICKEGIARTFQNIRLFKDLSVLDNVRIAMNKNVKYGLFTSLFHSYPYAKAESELTAKAEEFLSIFGLENKKDELAKNLPYGEQRHLEIARALATDPVVLLLDEPAAGMNPAETSELTKLIKWIQEKYKLTILLIEHDMSVVMKICEKIYVLDYGLTIAEGSPEDVKNNKRVIEAYLGEGDGNA